MNKYQEALNRLKTAPSFMGGTLKYIIHSINREELLMKDVNTLQELVDKETPKKVVEKEIMCWLNSEPHYYGKCPNCNGAIKNNGIVYCPRCGQKLDWSDE